MSSQQKNITPEFYIMSRIRPPNKSKRAIYSDLTDNKLMYVVEEKKNLKKELIKQKRNSSLIVFLILITQMKIYSKK